MSSDVTGVGWASAYPALAESDVPPSLPHRAETATTHAAQNLLISFTLHLRHRDMRDKNARGGGGGGEVAAQRMLLSERAERFTSETH